MLYPIASEIIENDTFVDDLLLGADSREKAQKARMQVMTLLNCGKF